MSNQVDLFSLVKPKINKIPDNCIPEGIKLKKGLLWCPYCSTPVKFKKDKKSGVDRCPICGISNRDYNVKMVNKNWR